MQRIPVRMEIMWYINEILCLGRHQRMSRKATSQSQEVCDLEDLVEIITLVLGIATFLSGKGRSN